MEAIQSNRLKHLLPRLPSLNCLCTSSSLHFCRSLIFRPLLNTTNPATAGSATSVVEAIQTNGLERLLRVYDVLSDPERMKEASLHLNGNFGVQRLLEAGAKLRAAMHGHALQVSAAAEGVFI